MGWDWFVPDWRGPMRKQHHLVLTPAQRADAQAVLAHGTHAALTTRHARILLEAEDLPGRRRRSDRQVADLCGVSARTVARVRAACATQGFGVALQGRPHPGAAAKLTGAQETRLLALACTAPPAGYVRWSLRLLAERAVELEALPPVSRELVRTTLKKTASSRGGASAG